jgi:hypothetical protein
MIICQLLLLFFAQRVYSYCYNNKECLTGCCYYGNCDTSDSCQLKEIDSYCSNDYECISNYCSGSYCAYSLGNSCSTHSDCLSLCCYHQYCNPASTCDGLLGEGEMCFNNYDCYSLTCNNNDCAPDPFSDLLGLNEKCAEHEECISRCCSSKSGKCIDTYECSNNAIGKYCFYDHECASDYCSNYHCDYLPEMGRSAQGFISIGLPILGAIVIAAGIVVMLKCCKKKLMNGRELDLEKMTLSPPVNSNNVSTSSIMAPSAISPNVIPATPLKA